MLHGKTLYCIRRLSALLIVAVGILSSCGSSSSSSDTYLPAKPTSLTVDNIDVTSVTIAWKNNADNDRGFSIERSVDGVTFTETTTTGSSTVTFTDNLPDDTVYEYRVCAFNKVGSSDYSNVVTVKRPKVATVNITNSAGGAVNLGSIATVTFPSGSFDSDQKVTACEGITGKSVPADKTPYLNLLSDTRIISAIDFTNNDLVLKKRATIVMRYDPDMISRFNQKMDSGYGDLVTKGVITQADVDKQKLKASDYDIYYFNIITYKWVKTQAILDANAHTLTVQAPYLGVYGLGYSRAAKTGISVEDDPDVQELMLDASNRTNPDAANDVNRQSSSAQTTCSSCSMSRNLSPNKPVYDSYTNCSTCPDHMNIDGDPNYKYIDDNITHNGKKVNLGCNNCSPPGDTR